jgi:hypothetical protein
LRGSEDAFPSGQRQQGHEPRKLKTFMSDKKMVFEQFCMIL